MTTGIWGDSISFGACDAEALGWVGRLRRDRFDADGEHVYNFGVCGETSTDVLKRFQVECDAIKPDQIIFAIGINDSKFPRGTERSVVSLDQYTQNMQDLIDRAKENTSNIVLIGPTAVGKEFQTPRSTFKDEEILKFRDALQQIAESNNILFIDMFEVLNPAIDLADGIHPNTEGYQKMFVTISKALV